MFNVSITDGALAVQWQLIIAYQVQYMTASSMMSGPGFLQWTAWTLPFSLPILAESFYKYLTPIFSNRLLKIINSNPWPPHVSSHSSNHLEGFMRNTPMLFLETKHYFISSKLHRVMCVKNNNGSLTLSHCMLGWCKVLLSGILCQHRIRVYLLVPIQPSHKTDDVSQNVRI